MLLAPTSLAVACPPRESEIVISEYAASNLLSICNTGNDQVNAARETCAGLLQQCEGLSCDIDCTLLEQFCEGITFVSLTDESCEGFVEACKGEVEGCNAVSPAACDNLASLCFDAQEATENVCGAAGLDAPTVGQDESFQIGARVVLTSGIDSPAITQSGCGQARLEGSRPSEGINEAIAAAIGDEGLQDESIEEPGDALVMLLLYWDRDGDGIDCVSDELFACAALGQPTGSDHYDVFCGSCQRGDLPAYSSAPCTTCILPYCQSLLP